MATITPLAAIRYQTKEKSDLSNRLSPPYDVLDASDKAALLSRDPHNFVAIDLPHVPPSSAGPREVYTAAAAQLDAWLASGILTREDGPSLYVYHQKFTSGGKEFVRKKFFARLKLEAFGEGQVFPHEKTFGGPKEDRLLLTQATKCNLSPIFGLYDDADNLVAATLAAGTPAAPIATGTLDQTQSLLWRVSDRAVIDKTIQLMAPKGVYIADGHHRYGTAMMYREHLTAQHGRLPDEHPANYVLCVFCAMEDPGLVILPTHRVLPGVSRLEAILKADAALDLREIAASSADEAVAAAERIGRQTVALFDSANSGDGHQRYLLITPRQPNLLDTIEPERSEAWRRLNLAFLHAYLIDRVISHKLTANAAPDIRYVKGGKNAIDAALSTNGCAFLPPATTMAEMRAVCNARDLMPQKSTFFYPKLASGLIINPLE